MELAGAEVEMEGEDIRCMWPELPGRPSFGFAIKHGVMPYVEPIDFATYLTHEREH